MSSARNRSGLDKVAAIAGRERSAAQRPGRKSTIINRLVGRTYGRRDIRASDSKGRHTTRRELVFLPNGGFMIDTPGMRELQLWDVGDAVSKTFDEIEALASNTGYRLPPALLRAAEVSVALSLEALLGSYVPLDARIHALRPQPGQARTAERLRALKRHLKTKRG
jgi:hypothetical protein